MTDPMELVDRLDYSAAANRGLGRDGLVTLLTEAAACIRELVYDLKDANSSVVAFGVLWDTQKAQSDGLPEGHLYPRHYDILSKAGGRMNDFTRHDPTAPGAEA